MASIETPQELFVHKLGAALTMEETILGMLENLQQEASDPKLQRDLQQHYRETQQHIENLRRVFQALGEEPETQSCPTVDGLEKEGKQMIKDADLVSAAAPDLRVAQAARSWLAQADDAGWGDRDYSAVLGWLLDVADEQQNQRDDKNDEKPVADGKSADEREDDQQQDKYP